MLFDNDTDDVDNNCIDNNIYHSAGNDELYDNVCAEYDNGSNVDYTENINNNWPGINDHS